MDEDADDAAAPEQCVSASSLFVSAVPDAMLQPGAQEGVLVCGRCAAKLGRWSWIGSTCDCGQRTCFTRAHHTVCMVV